MNFSRPTATFSFVLAGVAVGCGTGSTTAGEGTEAIGSTSSADTADATNLADAVDGAGGSPQATDNTVTWQREAWRRRMSRRPLPKEGCFRTSHPSTTWEEVPCGTAPAIPLTVGNTVDLVANVSPTTIAWSEGSFPIVNNYQTLSDFSLQLNPNVNFQNATTEALCSHAAVPANCWVGQQFIFLEWPDGGDVAVYMEYWVKEYVNSCTGLGTGWHQNGNDCYMMSASQSVPGDWTNPSDLILTGSAGSTDGVIVWTGDGTLYGVAAPSVLGLNTGWTQSEFNLVGYGNKQEAIFNADVTMLVQTLTSDGSSAPAACADESWTDETNNLTLVPNSCCTFGGAMPGIQFTESNVTPTLPPPFSCPSPAQPVTGGAVAVSQQFGAGGLTDLFTIDENGTLTLSTVFGNEPWKTPYELAGAGTFPPGAPLVATQQFGMSQTDVFAVNDSGQLSVWWIGDSGAWQGPGTFGSGSFNVGTELAASQQFGITSPSLQTDVFAVDSSGNLAVTWDDIYGVGGFKEISTGGHFPKGAPVAASNQFGLNDQTDVFVVDLSGQLNVFAVVCSPACGNWTGYVISPPETFPTAAYIAASRDFAAGNQTDVFVVDKTGTLNWSWVQSGAWQGPFRMGGGNYYQFPTSGAGVAASQQFGQSQTDVFAVDTFGSLWVFSNSGAGWSFGDDLKVQGGPSFPGGAPVAASQQFGLTQTDVFAINNIGLRAEWYNSPTTGGWQGPFEVP